MLRSRTGCTQFSAIAEISFGPFNFYNFSVRDSYFIIRIVINYVICIHLIYEVWYHSYNQSLNFINTTINLMTENNNNIVLLLQYNWIPL